MHKMTEQLQTDRKEQLYFKESHDKREQFFKNVVHPDNDLPPLPRSPCVRVKATGEIFPWHSSFADHPELCECCNEDGSPFDPANAMQPVARLVSTEMNTDISHVEGVGDERTPAVGIADKLLGTSFATDYTQETRREAMTLPEQNEPVPVDDLVKAVFAANV